MAPATRSESLRRQVAVIRRELPVSEALLAHYAAHDLPSDGGQSAAWFRVRIGPISIWLPNPPARRRAVFFHDVNHVLTGYDTAFSKGEMEIGAFEIGSGCGPFLAAWFLNAVMMTFGLVVRPRSVYRAFVRGRAAESIYRLNSTREALLARTVTELKETLGIDSATSTKAGSDVGAFALSAFLSSALVLGLGGAVVILIRQVQGVL